MKLSYFAWMWYWMRARWFGVSGLNCLSWMSLPHGLLLVVGNVRHFLRGHSTVWIVFSCWRSLPCLTAQFWKGNGDSSIFRPREAESWGGLMDSGHCIVIASWLWILFAIHAGGDWYPWRGVGWGGSHWSHESVIHEVTWPSCRLSLLPTWQHQHSFVTTQGCTLVARPAKLTNPLYRLWAFCHLDCLNVHVNNFCHKVPPRQFCCRCCRHNAKCCCKILHTWFSDSPFVISW